MNSLKEAPNLTVSEIRKVYLIVYDKVNIRKVPDRQTFVELVLSSFTFGKSINEQWIDKWACKKEHDENGLVSYYMIIGLMNLQRWPAVNERLQLFGIDVQFKRSHVNYYSALQLFLTENSNILTSPFHPNILEFKPPTTMAASLSLVKKKEKATKSTNKEKRVYEIRRKTRKRNIEPYDVACLAVKHQIKNYSEFLFFASNEEKKGNSEISRFLINKGKKSVEEAIQLGWEKENILESQKRESMSRLEILKTKLDCKCVCDNAWQWFDMAVKTLQRNNITKNDFSQAVIVLLRDGRGKYRNLLLKGPANCGKTFLLKPLRDIYEAFVNPSQSSFNWMGVEKAEIIFLDDFRWSRQLIQRNDLLSLLGGEPLHFPSPKNITNKDICFTKDTPIFATSKDEVILSRYGYVDATETEMMSTRWRVFNFSYQIPRDEHKEIFPCNKCFSELILNNDINDNV